MCGHCAEWQLTLLRAVAYPSSASPLEDLTNNCKA